MNVQAPEEQLEFLKQKEHWQIGDYLPNAMISSEQQLHLYDLITDHLLIAVVSTNCAPCLSAMEALNQFIEDEPDFNLIILIDTDEETFQLSLEAFHPSARVYRVSEDILVHELKIFGYPWSYGINIEGQIIAHDHCGELIWFENVVRPFRKLVQQSK